MNSKASQKVNQSDLYCGRNWLAKLWPVDLRLMLIFDKLLYSGQIAFLLSLKGNLTYRVAANNSQVQSNTPLLPSIFARKRQKPSDHDPYRPIVPLDL